MVDEQKLAAVSGEDATILDDVSFDYVAYDPSSMK